MDEIVEGQIYTVTWDGAVYDCVAYLAVGPNVPSIGNGVVAGLDGGNGEPFFITGFNDMVLVFAANGTHTVSVSTTRQTLQPLDLKYMPDGIKYTKKDTYDMVHGGPNEIVGERKYINMGDAPYSEFMLQHDTCIVDVASTGSIVLEDGTEYFAAGAQTAEVPITSGMTPSGHYAKINEYFNILLSADGTNFINIYEISAPSGATGGNAYVNKAFPKNFTGSVTVEFTLRAPISATAVEAFTMWSTTEGSTKRFRITVDDSGTLTATEV